MTSNRMFYRNIFIVEVLSEKPLLPGLSLSEVNYEITEGHCSGIIDNSVFNQKVSPEKIVKLLLKQGSDPEFFGLDEEGNDVDQN